MSTWMQMRDALGLTLRPIDAWPGELTPNWKRERAPYSAPMKTTLSQLKTELSMLRASEIVLQIAIREGDLRLDGLPRAQAVAEHPGVILSFKTPKGHRRRHFDRFTRWEYNLRALGENLNHLRMANLYGVEGDDAQYTGWKQLPSGEATSPEEAVRKAALFVGQYGGCNPNDIFNNRAAFQIAYREAANRLHPDRGGSHDLFVRLQEAAGMLKARHGL